MDLEEQHEERNRRRCDLILREFYHQLTLAEARELAELQRWRAQWLDRRYPRRAGNATRRR